MVRVGSVENLDSNTFLKIERIWRDGEERENPRKTRTKTELEHGLFRRQSESKGLAAAEDRWPESISHAIVTVR